jgi:predicted AAA+ superfamily ATPase
MIEISLRDILKTLGENDPPLEIFEHIMSKSVYLREFSTAGVACPRQKGKTTALKNIADTLVNDGKRVLFIQYKQENLTVFSC